MEQNEQSAQGQTDSPRCVECGNALTEDSCASTPVKMKPIYRSCWVYYDIQCFNCWKLTTIKVRVLSMFDIKGAEYEHA